MTKNLIILLSLFFSITAHSNSISNIAYVANTIEIIIFANPYIKITEESFSKYTGELNKLGVTEHFDLNTPLKALSREYTKLQNNKNYKIILHATKQFNLLPSQKNKKFLIKSPGTIEADKEFEGTLLIASSPTRNNSFNLTFDGIYANYRLTKTAKIKSKEIYYFDHPIFGVLITVY